MPVEITAGKASETATDGTKAARPTFSIVGYTGVPMVLSGFYSPVIMDLSGVKAASQEIPVLFGHDDNRIVGMTDSVKIDAEGVRMTGIVTGDNEHAMEVVSQAKNGFKWQASVGAGIDRREFLDAGKTEQVNGRTVSGPMVIARQSTIYEISFAAMGADGATSASVAASSNPGISQGNHDMNFDAWLQAKGFDPAVLSDTQKAPLKAAYDVEQKAAAEPPAKPKTNETLDQIVEAQRSEQSRVERITAIAAEAINDRPFLLEEFNRMAQAAINAKQTTVQEFELSVMRVRAHAHTPAVGSRVRSQTDTRAGAKVIEAALCLTGGLPKPEKHFDQQTLNAASDRFPRGIGLRDVLHMAARDNGHSGHFHSNDVRGLLEASFKPEIRAEGFSTLSLPGILGNTANKFLAAGFNAVEDTWRIISGIRSVKDFKAYTTYALTGGFIYEKVGPGGELKHADVSSLSYTNQVETYGRMFAITRTDLINDDLGALTSVPMKLGRGAALSLNNVFWTVFLNNSAFFTSGRANYSSGAGTALSITSLGVGETTFMNQTDPDGYPVAITPKILLVPNALAVTAANLMNSTMIANDTTANTLTLSTNPHAGKFTVAQSSYMSNSSYTGYSTTAWYLLADPADMPVIETAFLNGKDTPTVESAEADFNTLGVQFRGFHDFGVAMQEYRAGYKSAGA